ncbi:uncharacterized protein [Cicer arietinum]|uniref:Uncharacterized protein LOC101504436 n=1 Tax=Cicer arietinum TaxID=3827 RepID=A0A1S2XLX5_CICAR|nr:uncharacterized protein LOC101504436 [Cicer arietinum]
MGNSLRCCLACVLPCGALDLIRIVHLNGYVEEITRPITAGEVLKANPNHVLSTPSSEGVVRRILILSPETELKRGSIYFLIPTTSLPEKQKRVRGSVAGKDLKSKKVVSSTRNKKCDDNNNILSSQKNCEFKEIKNSRKYCRHNRSGVWQPHLESISEDLF